MIEILQQFADLFLHLDEHLHTVIQDYGLWTYPILCLIIYCETGLVVTPILPGDSLLFAAGTFAAIGSLDVTWLYVLLTVSAIAGDNTNYWIGFFVGPKIFHKEKVRFLNKEYLNRAHQFYEKYGGKTIILARFAPILRTFAPFVAGIGRMTYLRFLCYSVMGGTLWIGLCLFAGFLFGNIPFVRENFTVVILAIVAVSLLPSFMAYLKHRRSVAQSLV